MTQGVAEPSAATGLRRPRVGFLGVGWIGQHRLKAMVHSGAIEVGAIADPSADRAEEAGRLAPQAHRVRTLDELLELGLNGIVIATPTALHAEQAIVALERGIAVFCQKPLGRTADEAAAVVEAARKSDRLLAVDFSYRFTDGMRRVHDLVQRGALGRVFALDLVFHNAYGPDKAWFYDPALAGGGCVMDLGVHLVDLALWLLDFPEVATVDATLFSEGGLLSACRDRVEDYAVATLRLANGATVRIACSWRLPAGCDAVIAAEIYGTEGGAAFRNVDGSFYDFRAEHFRGTAREVLSTPPDDWGGRAAADWAARLAAGARFDPASAQLVTVARVLDRIYGI